MNFRLFAGCSAGAWACFTDSKTDSFRRCWRSSEEEVAPILVRFSGGDTSCLAISCAAMRFLGRAYAAEFEPGEAPPLCAGRCAADIAEDMLMYSARCSDSRLPKRVRGAVALRPVAQGSGGGTGISVNTARNQLKSVFEKLGVNRQSDLSCGIWRACPLRRA